MHVQGCSNGGTVTPPPPLKILGYTPDVVYSVPLITFAVSY